MYEYLNKIFREKGRVCLFPMQTGSGKSYNIAKVLTDALDTNDMPKAFIISPYWKLLDGITKDIQVAAENKGHSDKVLCVPSSEQAWMDFFTNDKCLRQIKKAIENDQDKQVIDDLNRVYKFTSLYEAQLSTNDLYEMLRQNPELPDLKRRLRRALKRVCLIETGIDRNYRGEAEKAKAVLEQFPFLELLYPEIAFYRYPIICMTASKLHYDSFNLITGETKPYYMNIPKGSLVIFDESDQCKMWGKRCFEDEILNSRNSEEEDKWSLYIRLLKGIDNLETRYTGPENEIHVPMRNKMLEELRKLREWSNSKLHLQDSLSAERIDGFTNGLGVIYHDMDAVDVNTDNNIIVESHPNHNLDYVVTSEEAGTDKSKHRTITYIDRGITIFFKSVMRILHSHIREYEANERERTKNAQRYALQSQDDIINEFLDNIGIQTHNDRRILRSYEGGSSTTARRNRETEVPTRSIYSDGISITIVREKYGSQRLCKLTTLNLMKFPEQVLCYLVKANDCQVVLSSATADIKDPLHNYDFNYIESEGIKITTIEQTAYERMQQDINSITPKHELRVGIFEDKINKVQTEDHLKILLNDEIALQKAKAFLSIDSYEEQNASFINLLRFYQDFCMNENAHAALVVTPYAWDKKMGKGDTVNGMNDLQYLFRSVSTKFKPGSEIMVRCLSGDSFGSELEEISSYLSKNNDAKAICLICYNSGSVGVNFEYNVTSSDKSKFSFAQNLRGTKRTCNFDSIFMEHPTRYVSLETGGNDYLRPCIDVSLLAERCYIDADRKNSYIRELVKFRSAKKGQNKAFNVLHQLYQTKAYKEFCIQQISQALGRLTRTPISRPTLTVCVDSRIAEIIALGDTPLAATKLYKSVQNALQSRLGKTVEDITVFKNDEVEQLRKNRYKRNNKSCFAAINNKIYACNIGHDDITDEIRRKRGEVEKWNDAFLKVPETNNIEEIPESRRDFYCKRQDIPSGIECPTVRVGLHTLMNINCIKKYFEVRGFQTQSLNAEYQLYETVTSQLYQARVTEHAFKALMEELGKKVKPLPEELYEQADWVVNDNVYVDVKSWAPSEFESKIKAEEWINKIKKCKGKYLIVNIQWHRGYKDQIIHRLSNGEEITVINGLVNLETGDYNIPNLTWLKHNI